MSNKRYQPILWFIMSMMFFTMLLLSALLAPSVSQADLPDRATPTPASSDDEGDDDDDDDGGTPLLASIELFASSASSGAWSVVQWQDPQGGWHDVEGWRSDLGAGYQHWTVEAKDFGTGLFRWQVRQGGPDGSVLSSSESFTLPAGANETLQISANP